MTNQTLWECLCDMSGEDGTGSILVSEAIARSAVPEAVGSVEIRKFAEQHLIALDGNVARLTESGRHLCSSVHHTEDVTETAAEDLPER